MSVWLTSIAVRCLRSRYVAWYTGYHPYPLDAADQALRDLKAGAFDGAAVLIP
jgi:hypothetical protein